MGWAVMSVGVVKSMSIFVLPVCVVGFAVAPSEVLRKAEKLSSTVSRWQENGAEKVRSLLVLGDLSIAGTQVGF